MSLNLGSLRYQGIIIVEDSTQDTKMRELLEQIRVWFLHLFEVHCPHCVVKCENCEYLKMQLAQERNERRELTAQILELTKPQIKLEDEGPSDIQPVTSKVQPWSVTRAKLERLSREEYERNQVK